MKIAKAMVCQYLTVLIKTGFGTSIVITIFILTKNNEHTLLWGDRVKLVQHKK